MNANIKIKLCANTTVARVIYMLQNFVFNDLNGHYHNECISRSPWEHVPLEIFLVIYFEVRKRETCE